MQPEQQHVLYSMLSPEKFYFPNGWECNHFSVIPSTNDALKEKASGEGCAHGTVIWADRQTAGKGRHGNQWLSPKGNLYCSIVLKPRKASICAGELAFVAGLAVADVAQKFCNDETIIQLKWPNDIMIEDQKAGGILIEMEMTKDRQIDWVVVGLGLNIQTAPTDKTCLSDHTGDVLVIREILIMLTEYLDQYYQLWIERGFDSIRKLWINHAYRLGETITVRLPKISFDGIFRGLNEQGALVVGLSDGAERLVTSGEVHFGDEK